MGSEIPLQVRQLVRKHNEDPLVASYFLQTTFSLHRSHPPHPEPLGTFRVRAKVPSPDQSGEPRKWNLLFGPGRPKHDLAMPELGNEGLKRRQIFIRREGRCHRANRITRLRGLPEPLAQCGHRFGPPT